MQGKSAAPPSAHALPVPVSFLLPYGASAPRKPGRGSGSLASVHAALQKPQADEQRTKNAEAVRCFGDRASHRAWHAAGRGLRSCVARSNGVAATGAHGKRGARAQGQRRKPPHT